MTDAVELKDAIRTQDADANVRISQSKQFMFSNYLSCGEKIDISLLDGSLQFQH